MKNPKICAVITVNDFDLAAGVDRFVDLYEVRIDLIGDGWQEWVGRLQRPWIATNRLRAEGGKWTGDESGRIGKLMEAVRLGAGIVDIELCTKDLEKVVTEIKTHKAECLISVHDMKGTPYLHDLAGIVRQEIAAGANICKIVTTAQRFEDNLTMLRLFDSFPDNRLVAFSMGQLGIVSRVLSPMMGGYFTYAAIVEGQESASGQLTATYLRSLYEAVRNNHD